jgi:hypothetical protein
MYQTTNAEEISTFTFEDALAFCESEELVEA